MLWNRLNTSPNISILKHYLGIHTFMYEGKDFRLLENFKSRETGSKSR